VQLHHSHEQRVQALQQRPVHLRQISRPVSHSTCIINRQGPSRSP
jgi:hypothetical protein